MSQEKREQLIADGRLTVADDGTETRVPDPAVAEAELEAAIADGRIEVDAQGQHVPTDVPAGTPAVDAEANPN